MKAGESPWLRTWVVLAAWSSVAAVGFAGGSLYVTIGAAVGIILGHMYSHRRERTSRLLRAALLVLFVGAVGLLRSDLWLILSGATLPLAYLFIIGQALGSFETRGQMSIYRSLVLGGLTLVIASGAALSTSYLFCLVAFFLLAAATLATANLEEQKSGISCIRCGGRLSSAVFWAAATLSFLFLAGLLFWSFPRINAVANAAPRYLPSRMEVVSGLPSERPSEPSAAAGFVFSETEGWDSPQGAGLSQTESQEAGNPQQARGKGASPGLGNSPAAIDLGYLGDGDTVVMNVRSPIASYWRGQLLDRYDGVRWSSSANRPSLPIDEVTAASAYESGKTYYWQTFYDRRSGPLPLFTGYIPSAVLLPEGSVQVVGKAGEPARFQLGGGLSYRVLSQVPDLSPVELRRDRASHQEPGYLRLPPIPKRVSALAEGVTREETTDFDKAMGLEQFLLRNYGYGDDLEPLGPGVESTDSFLFSRKKGTCSQFASAMAVMARLVGLPARVAIGYRPGAYDLWSGTYTVRAGDAHAWVEIYFRDHGWVPFDPTPSSSSPGPAGGLPLPRWNGLAQWQNSQLGLSIGGPSSAALTSAVTFGLWGEIASWPVLPIVVLVLAFGGVVGLWCCRRDSKFDESFNYSQVSDPRRQRVVRLFRKLEAILARNGFRPRHPSETITEYAVVARSFVPGEEEAVKWLAELTCRAAYDPQPINEDLVGGAARAVEAIARGLGRGAGGGTSA